jgi:hypothetical protein
LPTFGTIGAAVALELCRYFDMTALRLENPILSKIARVGAKSRYTAGFWLLGCHVANNEPIGSFRDALFQRFWSVWVQKVDGLARRMTIYLGDEQMDFTHRF